MEQKWHTDVLGAPFEQKTLPLGRDEEGAIFATLVRSLPAPESSKPLSDVDILYVHGWSDFFFRAGIAQYFNDLGARFYALDLRKYGRSLRPRQTPGYIDDLKKYDIDIAAALREMKTQEGGRKLILMRHSTGGLVLTLWASRHSSRAAALILNSPWFEFQTGKAAATL